MKFIYFYSKIYDFYNNHIEKNLSNYFELQPIKIKDIQPKNGHSFWGGVSIKLILVLEKIYENMSSTIVFSDATIFINSKNSFKIKEYFKKYEDNDLCFANNNPQSPESNEVNIGLILIKCNKDTLLFFEEALKILNHEKGWDQEIINRLIRSNNLLKIGRFDNRVYCGFEFDARYINDFLIYKSFIKHTDNLINNYNQRINKFYKANLINHKEYLELIK